MHIAFPCSGCGRKVRAPAAAAGKKWKCPHCGGVQTIPSLQEQTSPAPTAIPNDPPKVDRPPNNTMALADTGTSVPPGDPGTTVLPEDSAHHAGLTPPEAVKLATSPAECRLEHLTAELKKAEAEFDQAEAESRQAEAEVKMVKHGRHLREVERRESGGHSRGLAWEERPAAELARVAAQLREDQAEVDQAKAELTKAEAEVKMAERARHLTEVARLRKSATDEANSTSGAGRKAVVAEKEAGNALAEEGSLTQRAQSVLAAEHERHVTEEIERKSEYLPPVRHFYTKVAGVTYKNDDGTDRQEILSTCSPLETLRLEHEDNNPHDANAIRVCTADGRQIGHLLRDVASDVWWRMQHHFIYEAISANVTGGTKDCPQLGMNILLLVGRPGVREEEMHTYLDNIMPAVTADAYDDRSDGDDADVDDKPQQELPCVAARTYRLMKYFVRGHPGTFREC